MDCNFFLLKNCKKWGKDKEMKQKDKRQRQSDEYKGILLIIYFDYIF